MSQPPSILIAEDVGMAGELLRAIVENAGAVVTAVVTDGEDAVETFRQRRPDIVFVDMFMPKMNGLEVLRAIRAMDPMAFVVLVSAEAPMARVKEAHELGAQAFLVKPVRLAQVRALLEQFARIQGWSRGHANS
ncbi:MAG: response regulator [Gammaproteobacteria bacterium]|nr:response regulator [Gammaproteobacteria bacterium]